MKRIKSVLLVCLVVLLCTLTACSKSDSNDIEVVSTKIDYEENRYTYSYKPKAVIVVKNNSNESIQYNIVVDFYYDGEFHETVDVGYHYQQNFLIESKKEQTVRVPARSLNVRYPRKVSISVKLQK
ncbi:MAG: hypothetical protein K2K60_01365 [Clostridia bacterium]|nr:hypothetical protein [Clostridia bacterium]